MIISRKFERRLVSAVIASVVALLSFASVAQATERISLLNGFDHQVNAISEPDSNGTRYLGGEFTSFQPWDTGSGALIEASSGDVNRTFPKVDGTIYATAADGSGGFYIGGYFSCIGPNISGDCNGAGDVPRNNAARINADGSVNLSWNPNPNGGVLAIAVLGSTVYLGGNFSWFGDFSFYRTYAAAVNNTDGTPTDWNPNPNGGVSAIAVLGSTVYLGGYFSTVGGTPRNRAAAVNNTDGAATPWDPDPNSDVLAIAVLGSTVYLGGNFNTVGGDERNNAAAVNNTDGAATSWNPNLSGTVYAVGVSGSNVYLGGNFNTVGGTPRNRAAAVDADGTLTSWNPNLSGGVYAIAVLGSTVYLGGNFATVGGTPRNYAAAVNNTDGAATPWNPDPNSDVEAIAVLGSTIYLGGNFATVGGTPRNRAAAVGTDGTLTSWNPNLSGTGMGDSTVYAVGVSGSNVYLGGEFSTVGGTPRNNAAAVNNTDGAATPWDPDPNGGVLAIAVLGSTVYLGGEFEAVGGDERNYAAAVDNTDGAATSWNPDPNSDVEAIAVLGSTVYLGGDFTTVGGIARNRAAAVTTDGAGTPTGWNPDLNNTVRAVGVSGSTVYLGGAFTTVGDQVRARSAAVGTDGTLLGPWPGPLATDVLLSVTKSGSGSGTVASSPVGIDCGTTCSTTFAAGTSVTLTATPAGGSSFTGWSGSGCSGTSTCTVTMSEARAVTAGFAVVPPGLFNLAVTKSGTGAGTVSSSPAGIDCGSDCSETLVDGSSVTLTASPAGGSSFTAWSGAGCSGTSTCTVVMSAARAVDAKFTKLPSDLFRMRSVKGGVNALTSIVVLPGPGKLTQRVTRSSKAKAAAVLIVCKTSVKVTKAGTVKLTCKLSAATRAALRKRSLRVSVKTTFTPTGGLAASKTQVVTLKSQRPPPYTG